MMIGLIELCSVWDNNNTYMMCLTEYIVLGDVILYIKHAEPLGLSVPRYHKTLLHLCICLSAILLLPSLLTL
jgi:hypothetical protein